MPKTTASEITKSAIEDAQPGQWLWDGGARGVPGLGLRVLPSGRRTFLFRYRTTTGEQHFAKIGLFPSLTVEQARTEAKVLAGAVAKQEDPVRARKALREAPTLAELADEYLGDYARASSLRPSTIRDAQSVLVEARSKLGRVKVVEVRTADIRRLHGDARAKGKEAAAARVEALEKAIAEAETKGKARSLPRLRKLTDRARARARGQAGAYQANRLLAVLSKMFSLAIELGWRSDNPCRGVKKFPEDQRWRNLSDDEVARLLGACDAYEREHVGETQARNAADAVRLLLFTGARLQEALKAEWAQFDLEVGLWEKPSAYTKSKRQHRLELDGPALELLRDMRQRDPAAPLLFPGDASRAAKVRPLKIKPRVDLKRPWAWISREAHLEGVRIHDLRRTTASFMLSGGASLATVGKALGHTQASTTQRYAHLSQSVQRDELRKAGERMAALKGRQREFDVAGLPSASRGGT